MPRQPVLFAYRPYGLGDLLVVVPALRALADSFPDHHRVLVTPAVWAPLAELTGAVDEVVDTQRHTITCTPFTRPPIEEAAVVVNLQGRGPGSHRMLLSGFPAARHIAFGNAEAGVAGPAWRPGEHEMAKWCRMLSESGIPADPSRFRLPAPDREPPERAVGAVLVAPGAAYGARRWPLERWVEVTRWLRRNGHRPVITGHGADEVAQAREIARQAGVDDGAVLAGATGDVLDLAAVVAAAVAVVAPDSGPAHLATALGTPSVLLFGPSAPAVWGPPARESRHRVLWHGVTGDAFADEVDPGLARITVDEVLTELDGVLAGSPAR
ncbi:glycosyltransferase family 9 protein [Actinosynnema sp. NPDC023794]